MDKALKELLNKYTLNSENDYENAIKEIIQQLALLGLWRSKFYEHAAFYGGTALRIFYGLRRFSEDLDFSLLKTDENFELKNYIESIGKELNSFGFEIEVKTVNKSIESLVESAFLKGNTRKNLIYIEAPDSIINTLPLNKKLKIKLEVDTNPPAGANYETKTLLTPIPFSVRLYEKSDLLAGKIHAILCRKWKTRVKGRDYYDFIWYMGQNIPCHLEHLKERMIQTNHIKSKELLNKTKLKNLLVEKFNEVNFEQAKKDVEPFIRDPMELDMWTKDFFLQLANKIEVL